MPQSATEMKKALVLFISALSITACSDSGVKIIDHYRVYKHVDFDYSGNLVHADHVLVCKLGGGNDPFIENVVEVEWNESAIVAKTDKGHFVIESNSYGLCCSCANKTIGPLDDAEWMRYKAKTNFEPISRRVIQ